MPWTAKDAQKHTKKADTAKKQRQWAKVANEARQRCLDDGGGAEKCDASAIRQANAVVGKMAEADVGGPGTCVCPECGYETEKKRGVPCRSMSCPECGAGLVAKVTGEADMRNVGQIAKSAIEVALAVVRNTGEIAPERAEKLLFALEADLGEVWQPGASVPVTDGVTFDVDGQRVPLAALLDTYREAQKTEDTREMYGDAVAEPVVDYGPTSFADLDAADEARQAAAEAEQRTWQYHELINNTIRSSLIKDKKQALKALADEFLSRVTFDVQNVDTDAEAASDLVSEGMAVEVVRDATEEDTATLGEALPGAIETGRRSPVVVDFQVLSPGPGNRRDNHYYPANVLERDIHVFQGADVFATDHREDERSERTKVGKVLQCPTRFTEARAPVARVLLYDPGQAEKTRNRADAGQLGTLECSILGRGVAKKGKVGETEYNVVQSLTEGRFLELVSKAGAGGHALNLAESIDGGVIMPNEQEQAANETPEQEQVTEVNIEEAEQAQAQAETEQAESGQEPEPLAETAVDEALAKTNLPQTWQGALKARRYETAEALQEAIAAAITEVKALTGSGQVFGQGDTAPAQEQPLSEAERKAQADAQFSELASKYGLPER